MWTLSSLILWHRILATTFLVSQAPHPFVVVLDPGHGGTEKGACRPGTKICEKDLTLKVAKEAAADLSRAGNIRVLLTRTNDHHVPLYRRVAIAQEMGADLLVSIHANASPKRNQRGYEIYVYPDEPRVGQDQPAPGPNNQSVADWSRDTILADLKSQGLERCSRTFGAELRTELRRRLGRRGDRGLLTGEMAVLAGDSVPSVLFEMGFIDHPVEGRRLLSPGYRHRIVTALVLAIRRWAVRASALGCRRANLDRAGRYRVGPASRHPDRPRDQGRKLPRLLRKHLPRTNTRQLVVSADPMWRRR